MALAIATGKAGLSQTPPHDARQHAENKVIRRISELAHFEDHLSLLILVLCDTHCRLLPTYLPTYILLHVSGTAALLNNGKLNLRNPSGSSQW